MNTWWIPFRDFRCTDHYDRLSSPLKGVTILLFGYFMHGQKSPCPFRQGLS